LRLSAERKGDTLGAFNQTPMGLQAARDDLTTLLGRLRTGTPDDRERLLAAVPGELCRTAVAYMRRERRNHILQPTALVNEAYLRLINEQDVRWEDRAYSPASRPE
jgi:RNA polymerase sigma-70 factor (ECF subfamily)